MVAQVSISLDAEMRLRRTLGLRAQVSRAVTEVLEAALEIRRLGIDGVPKDAPLIIRVGSCLVTYSLDLEHKSATVWRVEPVS